METLYIRTMSNFPILVKKPLIFQIPWAPAPFPKKGVRALEGSDFFKLMRGGKMAFRWRADNGTTWQLYDFQRIRTSIARKPYIFVIFQGGGGPDPLSAPMDPRMDNLCCLLITFSNSLDPD